MSGASGGDDRWGGTEVLSAWESLMWRVESDPRTRSTGLLIEVLDREPDWDRVRAALRRLVDAQPRLRDRVVEPTLPLVSARWSTDPEFDLEYHLQRVRLPGEGSTSELLDFAAAQMARPLDRARPPWETTLVTGLADGRAAFLFKVHHSLSDGMGLVQLLDLAHSRTAEPGHHDRSPVRTNGAAVDPFGLLVHGLSEQVTGAPRVLFDGARDAVGAVAAGLTDPAGTARRAVEYAGSLRRMLTPPPVDRSPSLRGASQRSVLLWHDVPLARLRAAGKAAGGSVNDAYLAAVLGAFRRFHEKEPETPERIPLAFPVSVRTADDTQGGNRFAGARFAAPLAEPDPAARIREIHEFVRAVRAEPALGFLDVLAPAMTVLPTAAVTELSSSLTATTDIQASNIPGVTEPVYLAGARVEGIYPLGPRPGIAAMITMLSYAGTGCVGFTVEPSLAADRERLEQCVQDGFDEVLALADDTDP
jgi:WS/DGAT/MGAT family acyltransferase